MGLNLNMWVLCLEFLLFGLACFPSAVTGQLTTLPDELNTLDPCRDTTSNAIALPRTNQCVVPVKQAMDWRSAQIACNTSGGVLYTRENLIIDSDEMLMRCLAAKDDMAFTDVWFYAIGTWLPFFYWNAQKSVGSRIEVLNPPTYCTTSIPQADEAALESSTLSVDFCVSHCHEKAKRFIVYHHRGANPSCFCLGYVLPQFRESCGSRTEVDLRDKSTVFIIHSKENSLIKISENNGFTSSEFICATVDRNTITDRGREMHSETCFTELYFICDLGSTSDCQVEKCTKEECIFFLKDQCLKRVHRQYSWYEATNYCGSLGGSLWKMKDLNEMSQVGQYIVDDKQYWIGAANNWWAFSQKAAGYTLPTDTNNRRCGHMVHQQNNRIWSWGDANCDKLKSFMCQFDAQPNTYSANMTDDVVCPWPIPAITLAPTPVPVTNLPPEAFNSNDDDGFPIAALIAGIIAGLILLTCLAVALTFCWKRQWAVGKLQKAKERLAFIPYFSDSSQMAIGQADFENMSNAGHMRSNMSSVSEHGSQSGLIKGGGLHSTGFSNHAFTSSYNDQGDIYANHKNKDGQNFNSSLDAGGFASTYNTNGSKPKDYMTLTAEMTIQDDAKSLRGSLRGKPEVTLVTDHVDMNFTVNHAMSHDGNEAIMSHATNGNSHGNAGMSHHDSNGVVHSNAGMVYDSSGGMSHGKAGIYHSSDGMASANGAMVSGSDGMYHGNSGISHGNGGISHGNGGISHGNGGMVSGGDGMYHGNAGMAYGNNGSEKSRSSFEGTVQDSTTTLPNYDRQFKITVPGSESRLGSVVETVPERQAEPMRIIRTRSQHELM